MYFADKNFGLEEEKIAEQRDNHKPKTKNLSNLGSDFIPYANVNESKHKKKLKVNLVLVCQKSKKLNQNTTTLEINIKKILQTRWVF
jgi:hypothetical protein